MASENLIEALAVTAELLGTQLSGGAKRVMLMDLDAYPESAVILALGKCRRELKGRLTIAEIVARIDDGRPGAEEAWAMIPRDEDATAVWTEEMVAAWAVARQMINAGEEIPARMAFKEKYLALVADARNSGRGVVWSVSLGQDANERETALSAAVSAGRISAPHAAKLLPHHHQPSPQFTALLESAGGAPRLRLVGGAA